jgi:hypothetical protein
MLKASTHTYANRLTDTDLFETAESRSPSLQSRSPRSSESGRTPGHETGVDSFYDITPRNTDDRRQSDAYASESNQADSLRQSDVLGVRQDTREAREGKGTTATRDVANPSPTLTMYGFCFADISHMTETRMSPSPSSSPPSDLGSQNSTPSGYDAEVSYTYISRRIDEDLRESDSFPMVSNQGDEEDQYRQVVQEKEEAEEGLDGTLSLIDVPALSPTLSPT